MLFNFNVPVDSTPGLQSNTATRVIIFISLPATVGTPLVFVAHCNAVSESWVESRVKSYLFEIRGKHVSSACAWKTFWDQSCKLSSPPHSTATHSASPLAAPLVTPSLGSSSCHNRCCSMERRVNQNCPRGYPTAHCTLLFWKPGHSQSVRFP